jgi:hypothetical protein
MNSPWMRPNRYLRRGTIPMGGYNQDRVGQRQCFAEDTPSLCPTVGPNYIHGIAMTFKIAGMHFSAASP